MINRRSLIQSSLKIIALAPAASAALYAYADHHEEGDKKKGKGTSKKSDAKKKATDKKAAGKKKADDAKGGAANLVDPATDPVAKALKYNHDSSKATGKVEKMGVKPEDQNCSNCQLFVASGKGAYGKCTMIASGNVKEGGWCTSWIKKA